MAAMSLLTICFSRLVMSSEQENFESFMLQSWSLSSSKTTVGVSLHVVSWLVD